MVVKVQRGETMETLARRYHTTVEDIKTRNRWEGDIYAGARLWIVGYLWHVWTPEDTIDKVCARYGVKEETIEAANESFSIGKRIKIPI